MKQESLPNFSSSEQHGLNGPSPQLNAIFRKIEQNSRPFRPSSGRSPLESQNEEFESLENSPLFQGSKSNQRTNDQLAEIRELLAKSQSTSQRLVEEIEALKEQIALQALERSKIKRDELSIHLQASRWARFAFIVGVMGLVLGVLSPWYYSTQPTPVSITAGMKEQSLALQKIEAHLSRIDKVRNRSVKVKTRRAKFRKKN